MVAWHLGQVRGSTFRQADRLHILPSALLYQVYEKT